MPWLERGEILVKLKSKDKSDQQKLARKVTDTLKEKHSRRSSTEQNIPVKAKHSRSGSETRKRTNTNHSRSGSETRKRTNTERLRLRQDNIRILSLENKDQNYSDEDFCPEKPKSFASLGKAQQIKRLKQLKPARSKTVAAGKGVRLNDTVLATKNLDTLSSLDKRAKTIVTIDPSVPDRVGLLLESGNPVHAGGIWNSLNNIVSE